MAWGGMGVWYGVGVCVWCRYICEYLSQYACVCWCEYMWEKVRVNGYSQ